MIRPIIFATALLSSASCTTAFAPAATAVTTQQQRTSSSPITSLTPLKMSDSPDTPTQLKIQSLVDDNPVLLFMKGSKLFPQCGFSNTACQILQSYNIDFETVDVLADEQIRQGVKDFSQWPTIPQLYVCGEFVGGSDIMIEMYQSGELGEMIEKAKADMV
ncbi:glutaredoxin [Skeletonema marinoi]|uniref:Glutaredoxin n=1 Tax=Skeletonema marinoi TaxID=267567 RepID=A0AAD8YAT4_9STRA|nr:glutaredoxin [Skeletonema marinoi]